MRHVIVDGSNIATEGRSAPSFKQLQDALRDFRKEYPAAELTVVVDASFGHRVDKSERARFEKAETAGEVVSPPAGAVGRGDAFLLRIAERTGAAVLSNDSFQEFHGEHDWLFSDGRLIGGKPVRGVGWIFTPRTPVRGARSKVAISKAEAAKAATTRAAKAPKELAASASGPRAPAQAKKPVKKAAPRKVKKAIAEATAEAVSAPRRRRPASGSPPESVNDPLTFITFIAEHPLGSRVDGVVERFTSHGAFARVNGTRCYVPLSGLGSPPPRRAREVLSRGESRSFVVQALDAPRRGVELALPRVASVRGTPSEETVSADIAGAAGAAAGKRLGPKPATARSGAGAKAAPSGRAAIKKRAGTRDQPAGKQPARKERAKKQEAKKKKQEAKKQQAKRAAPKRAAAKRAASKRPGTGSPAKKEAGAARMQAGTATTKRPASDKTPARKTAAKRRPVRKATAGTRSPGEAKSRRGRSGATRAKAPSAKLAAKAGKALGAKRASGARGSGR